MEYLYIFTAAIAFGVVFNIHGKKLIYAALGGVLSWFAYVSLAILIPNETIRYFIAAIVLSLYSEILARVHKSPVTLFMVIAIIPLVPGNSIYYAMEHFVTGETELFNEVGINTLSIAGAIAMGIVLTSSVMTMYFNWKRLKKISS